MTADTPRTFRTKTGTCTITGSEIVLAREGARGAMAEAVVGTSIHRLIVRYLVIAGCLGFLAVSALEQGSLVLGCLYGSVAAFIGISAVRSRNNSAAPRIPRSSIRRVEARRALPPLTRGYFVVHFAEGNQLRKRLIILPGVLSGGGEFERALRVMREAGLTVSST